MQSAFEFGTIYINGIEVGKTGDIEWQKHPKIP
jgi:hypothetical protein